MFIRVFRRAEPVPESRRHDDAMAGNARRKARFQAIVIATGDDHVAPDADPA